MKNNISKITFAQLREMVRSTVGMKLPTAKALRNGNARIVVRCELQEEVYLTAYDNGFVLYETPSGNTVLRLDNCKDYIYVTQKKNEHLAKETFDDMHWSVRVMLEGEDRLSHNNQEAWKRKAEPYDSLSIEYLKDTNAGVLEQIIRNEQMERLMMELTQHQREVFTLYYICGYKLREIAAYYRVSHQAISISLECGRKKLKKT